MFALVVSCHNLGVAVASAVGAWLLSMLGCNPRGGPNEEEEFQSLWLASGISSIFVIHPEIFGSCMICQMASNGPQSV